MIFGSVGYVTVVPCIWFRLTGGNHWDSRAWAIMQAFTGDYVQLWELCGSFSVCYEGLNYTQRGH
jgi:hypothetical protein